MQSLYESKRRIRARTELLSCGFISKMKRRLKTFPSNKSYSYAATEKGYWGISQDALSSSCLNSCPIINSWYCTQFRSKDSLTSQILDQCHMAVVAARRLMGLVASLNVFVVMSECDHRDIREALCTWWESVFLCQCTHFCFPETHTTKQSKK